MKLKKLLIGCTLIATAHLANANSSQINGAGSSFIFPIFSQWANTYFQQSKEKINYQSIGSGGGIRQIIQGTVHFAATDAPLSQEELETHQLIQFPIIMGGVIPTHNIAGINANELRLEGSVLADIFASKITHWNDARIAALNPHLTLPNKTITVVHRADGSGTTWMLSDYLSKVSPSWRESIGSDKSINWPKGVGAKGNEGVANYIKRIDGSIGYVELAYVLHNKMKAIQLKNQAGQFVSADLESLKAAAANADWDNTPSMAVVLTNQPGEASWPITGATFALIAKPVNSANNQRLQKFLSWGWREGAEQATALAYVPLPISLVEKIEAKWQQ